MAVADAFTLVLESAAEAVEPDAELQLDSWAEDNVVIPKGSAFPGPYRLAKTPYARRLLQALSPSHPARYVVARVASQMLKTQVFICAALGWIHSAPANILALEPNATVTSRLSNRLQASIDACDSVKGKVAKPRSRSSRNTLEDKEFDGGHLYILTAGSDANLAEVPVRYLFCDEINREGWVTGAKEGSRVKLALARQTSYGDSAKAYLVSSPTALGMSEITDWFEQGTQEHYHVPCPHCGHLHELVVENFHFHTEGDAVTRAWMVCPECGAEIDEHDKVTMLPSMEDGGQARWIATSEGDGQTISVTLSAFYAPLGSISWLDLARELRAAREKLERGSHEEAMVFWNTRLGLDYDRRETTSTTAELMKRAAEEGNPPRVVPDRALVLTMYADTQPNRLEVTTEAWGPGMEHWTIDHRILWGSPTDPPDQEGSVWQRLDELRRTPYAHASGVLIKVSAYGIDSGGHNTQDVYNYGSQREALGCIVTKGHSVAGRAVIAARPSLQDIDWQGNKRPDGIRLWMLGTDTAKDWLHNRRKLVGGPGAAHWCTGLDEDFFEQLLAEKPQTVMRGGRLVRVWTKPQGARNEVLDCAVGNLALAHHLELHRWSNQDWQRLRDNLVPRSYTPDLFAAADAVEAPAATPEPPPAHLAADRQDVAAAIQQHPAPEPSPTPIHMPAPAQPAGRRILSRGLHR